jgi:hypothetical protein
MPTRALLKVARSSERPYTESEENECGARLAGLITQLHHLILMLFWAYHFTLKVICKVGIIMVLASNKEL